MTQPSEVAHCAGRLAKAHDRTPMVDGVCPVCGERETCPDCAQSSWDGERCHDCSTGYSDVYWLPDAWWAVIAPDPARPDAGMLCPDCALRRLREAVFEARA